MYEENCARLGYVVESSGNFSSTFRDYVLVPSSRVRNPKRIKNPTTRCVVTQKNAILIHFATES